MEVDGLRFETVAVDGGVIVKVAGELDLATERAFIDFFAAQSPVDDVIEIDLTGVPFIDSRGLNTLVRTLDALRARGVVATVVNVAPQGLELLDMTGLRDQLMQTGDAGA